MNNKIIKKITKFFEKKLNLQILEIKFTPSTIDGQILTIKVFVN